MALRVTLLNGFTPAPGSSFTIIAAGGAVEGRFAVTDLPEGFEVAYLGGSVVIGRALCLADLTTSSDPNHSTYGSREDPWMGGSERLGWRNLAAVLVGVAR